MPPKPKSKLKKASAKKAPAKKPPAKTQKTKPAKESTEPAPKVRANVSVDVGGCVPIDAATGLPLLKITVSASEKIPTGEYANVDIGPVSLEKYIRDPQDDDKLVEEINDLCELIEVGVVAEQRELVLQSLQNAAESE